MTTERITTNDLLKAAGKVATAARNLVGGQDINGFRTSGASLYTVSECAKDLRAALDAYDLLILEHHSQTKRD